MFCIEFFMLSASLSEINNNNYLKITIKYTAFYRDAYAVVG